MKHILILLFILFSKLISAEVIITGTALKGEGLKMIYLIKIIGNDTRRIDSTNSIDNKFRFQELYHIENGVYRIVFSKTEQFDFVLCDNKNVEINVDLTNINDSLNYNFNKENQAFYHFQSMYNNFKIRMIIQNKNRAEIQKNTATIDVNVQKIKKEFLGNNLFFRDEIASFKHKYPDTYASDVLINFIQESPIDTNLTGNAYLSEESEKKILNYFNYWDFRADNIINNQFIAERLQFYFSRVCFQSEVGLKNAVDILMNRVNSAQNTEVKDFMSAFLLKHFMRFGPIEIAIYVSDNYLEGCSSLPIAKESADLIGKMKKVTVGQNYIDVIGLNPDGVEKKLSNYISGKKCMMLIFWSSTCSHCTAELPKLKSIYDNYKSKGFEIVAFSLDANSEIWKQALLKMQYGWINLTDLKGFNSVNVKNYFVNRTPASVLIDKNGIIVAKNKWDDELVIELEKLLK